MLPGSAPVNTAAAWAALSKTKEEVRCRAAECSRSPVRGSAARTPSVALPHAGSIPAGPVWSFIVQQFRGATKKARQRALYGLFLALLAEFITRPASWLQIGAVQLYMLCF